MLDLNVQPYYDDHTTDSSFLKVLFRPSYPVQAREMTQLQSILQTQIERFGSHIFKTGSKVLGGDLSNNKVHYLKLDELTFAASGLTIGQLTNMEVRNSAGVRGKIVALTKLPTGSAEDIRTLYIKYTTGGAFTSGENIEVEDLKLWVKLETSETFTGPATVISINSGVFYVNGYFVHTAQQSMVLDQTWEPSAKVGLAIYDYIQTESEDSTLLDPAYGTSNYNAPGAHRYVVDIEISSRPYSDINETDENFIELLRIKDGEPVSEVKNPTYNEIEKELARRTYDESGSYTVKRFDVSFEPNDADDSHINAVLEAGKAYVNGYEFETISKSVVSMEKARDTEHYNNADAYVSYGFYYTVKTITGGMFRVNQMESIELRNGSNVVIGSARVKSLSVVDGSTYNLYMTDVEISGGGADSVRRIVGASSGAIATVDVSKGTTDLMRGSVSSLIAPFYPENPKPGSISDVQYTTQRQHSGVLDAENRITISTSSSSERFVGTGSYVGNDLFIKANYVFVVNGVVTTPTEVNIPTVGNAEVGRLVATFTTNGNIEILATVNVNSSTPRLKTRKSATKTTVVGNAWTVLDYVDVIKSSVVVKTAPKADGTGGGIDLTSTFQIDDGQRDEYYDLGRVRRGDGNTAVSVVIEYDYYEHTGIGYFNVDSYSNENYEEIPTYESGSVSYDLKSCFDFRTSVTGSVYSQIPLNNTSVGFDYDYYLPRADLIVVTKNREFAVVKGTPAIFPRVPDEPTGTMSLYVVRMAPYTASMSDVSIKFVENKRYTMRDIGKLEQRIENLEYYASLSLLETKTDAIHVEGKFRNGFLVDPFVGTDVTELNHPECDCYIDVNGGICSPTFVPKSFPSNLSQVPSDVVHTVDDILIKKYSEERFINQGVITGEINVNPFDVFEWVGEAKMIPEVDNWIEETRIPDIIQTIGAPQASSSTSSTKNKTVSNLFINEAHDSRGNNAAARNQLMNDYAAQHGAVITSTGRNDHIDRTNWGQHAKATLTQQTTTTTTTSSTLVNDSNTDREVSRTAIPYIRTKDVEVNVTGLLPGKVHYFQFDDVNVDAHVAPFGTTNFGSPIKTDGSGELRAVFRIPAGVFKTGVRMMKISDHQQHNPLTQTSHAMATYTAEGVLITRQRTIVRRWTSTTSTSTSSKNLVSFTWSDPLAQTFLVDGTKYPDGVFLSSVDLYFTTKDNSIPVTVQIRPTVNGYPHSQEVYQFGSKTLYPKDVVLNNPKVLKGYTGAPNFLPTRFKFDTPVYLPAGEHSFVVLANSNKYHVGFATIGKVILNTSKIMAENPYNGVMFMSQNASTWSADQYSDLAFDLNRCKFEVGPSAPIIWDIALEEGESVEFDAINFSTSVTAFQSTDHRFDLTTRIDSTNERDTKRIDPSTNNLMSSRRIASVPDEARVSGVITATDVLSPVIDQQRTHFITVENIVNNDSTNEEVPYSGKAIARYIHKKVELVEDYIATDMRVWVDAYLPDSSSIKVYVKHQNTTIDNSPFHDLGWVEMDYFATAGYEMEYRADISEGFSVYQVKIVFLSPDTTKVPSIASFRVVTFQE